jgi:hypothetical protein
MITFVAAVIFQESQIVDKHALINSLTKLLLIINIMTLAVTQKPFITHLRHVCLSLFFLQTYISHPCLKPMCHRLISQNFTHAYFSLNRIHSFILFQYIFAFIFPFRFALRIKPFQFPFHDYIPLFSSPC